MSRTLSPCQFFPTRVKTRVIVLMVAGFAALTLAAPAGAHHRDRPHAPKKVSVVDVGVDTVRVSWTRTLSARTYRLFRNGVSVRWKSAPRVHTFGSLTCDRSYTFAVRAYDAAGRRSRARAVTVRTDACPPRNTALPSIAGTPAENETLTASPGSWVGAEPITFSYQWGRCAPYGGACLPISGATGSTYVVTASDSTRTLRVRVRAVNASGWREATSPAVGVGGGTPDPDPEPDPDPDPDPEPDPDPDPEPDPDPDPNGGCSVADTSGCVPGTTLTRTDAKFLCDRPLSSYGQLPLKVVLNFTPGRQFGENGAIDLYTGCAGDGNANTIDLIVDVRGNGTTYGPGVDAFKVRQAAGYNAGIQVTGHIDCGPRYAPDVHQDGVQLQGGRNITFVDFSVGNYATGRSTCQGAGGAFFYSGASGYVPTNIDVVRGSYIACNHSLFMGLGSGDVLNAHFRSGRTDGTDPLCTEFAASPACTGDAPGVTMASVTCQRWNASGDRWE
jgi:hypothetical protein